MKKCKSCEIKRLYDLFKEIAEKSIIVTHKDYSVRGCDYESMVNTIWIMNLIQENFKLK
jgi:hypothetical protein